MDRNYDLMNDSDLKEFNESIENEVAKLNKEEAYTYTLTVPEKLIGIKLRRDVVTQFDGSNLTKDEQKRFESRLIQLRDKGTIGCEIETVDKWAFKIQWRKNQIVLFDLYAGILTQESILAGISNNDYELLYGQKVEELNMDVKETPEGLAVGNIVIPKKAFDLNRKTSRSFKLPFEIDDNHYKIVQSMVEVMTNYLPLIQYKWIVVMILEIVYGLNKHSANDLSKIILARI